MIPGATRVCARIGVRRTRFAHSGNAVKDFDRDFLGWVPLYAVNPFWVPRPRLCVGVSSNVKRIRTPTQSRGRGTPI